MNSKCALEVVATTQKYIAAITIVTLSVNMLFYTIYPDIYYRLQIIFHALMYLVLQLTVSRSILQQMKKYTHTPIRHYAENIDQVVFHSPKATEL